MKLFLKITDGGAMYLSSESVSEDVDWGDIKHTVTRIDGENSDDIYDRLMEAHKKDVADWQAKQAA